MSIYQASPDLALVPNENSAPEKEFLINIGARTFYSPVENGGYFYVHD
ncbi:MAG: hypothetical protein HRT38_15105 [Alteromonadaceae bacterium]|nr:hypothetical protein [Alteromonadaceae bacterium]